MTSKSPTPREQRFDQLCAEINDLIARYPAMPPGRPQSICQAEIEKRYREIDGLNAEQYAEDLASSRTAHFSTGSGQRQAAAIAMILIVTGLAFRSYTMIAVGGAVVLLCMGVGRSRSVPEPPEPAHERFQWRP